MAVEYARIVTYVTDDKFTSSILSSYALGIAKIPEQFFTNCTVNRNIILRKPYQIFDFPFIPF